MRSGKDYLGHNWQGHACLHCERNAWTEAAMWPCESSKEITVVCDGWVEPRHERKIMQHGDPSRVSHSMCRSCELAMGATL